MPVLLLSYCSMGYGEIGVSRRLHCCCPLLIGDQGGYADTMLPAFNGEHPRPTNGGEGKVISAILMRIRGGHCSFIRNH